MSDCKHEHVTWGPLGHDEQEDGTFDVWQLGDCLDCGATHVKLEYEQSPSRRAEFMGPPDWKKP